MIQRFDKIDKESREFLIKQQKLLKIEKQSIKALAFNKYEHNGLVGWEVEAKSATKKMRHIIVPKNYKDQPVLSIKIKTFEDCTSLEKLTMPFAGRSLCETTYNRFANLFSWMDFNPEKNVPPSLKEVEITGGTVINNNVFSGCENLTTITLHNTITTIGDWAFSACSSLREIILPNSIRHIGEDAFYNCSSLTNITIDEDNTDYKSIDGNLYNIKGTNLIRYAIGKKDTSFTIPDTVVCIHDGAFSGANNLTEVIIPNDLTEIRNDAFINCHNLTTITIPKSVKNIGKYAFVNAKLKTAIFEDAEGWIMSNKLIAPAQLKNPNLAAKLLKDGNELIKK